MKYNKKRYSEDPYYKAVFNARSRMSKILREKNMGKKK